MIAARDGNHPKYSLQQLYDEAEGLLNLVDEYEIDSADPLDPGFMSSYLIYPKANALA